MANFKSPFHDSIQDFGVFPESLKDLFSNFKTKSLALFDYYSLIFWSVSKPV